MISTKHYIVDAISPTGPHELLITILCRGVIRFDVDPTCVEPDCGAGSGPMFEIELKGLRVLLDDLEREGAVGGGEPWLEQTVVACKGVGSPK